MPRITNNYGLPQPIVDAVANDPYDRGASHISVTGLIGPARKRRLEIDHADEIEEDAADRIWALMGQVAHGILQRADVEAVTEQRLFIERYGWVISGSFDRLVVWQDTLQDYKVTSVYATKGGVKEEWEQQLNLYRHMLQLHGITVERAQIVAIYRDYQKSKAKHDPSYPQAPVAMLDVPLWSAEQCEAFIKARLLAHGKAQDTLPDCTPTERWERPSVWALTKVGNKKASSIHATKEEGEAALAAAQAGNPKSSFLLEHRAGESVRCAGYCPAAPFCDQWRTLNPNKLGL